MSSFLYKASNRFASGSLGDSTAVAGLTVIGCAGLHSLQFLVVADKFDVRSTTTPVTTWEVN